MEKGEVEWHDTFWSHTHTLSHTYTYAYQRYDSIISIWMRAISANEYIDKIYVLNCKNLAVENQLAKSERLDSSSSNSICTHAHLKTHTCKRIYMMGRKLNIMSSIQSKSVIRILWLNWLVQGHRIASRIGLPILRSNPYMWVVYTIFDVEEQYKYTYMAVIYAILLAIDTAQ